jgi:hypothetical protein
MIHDLEQDNNHKSKTESYGTASKNKNLFLNLNLHKEEATKSSSSSFEEAITITIFERESCCHKFEKEKYWQQEFFKLKQAHQTLKEEQNALKNENILLKQKIIQLENSHKIKQQKPTKPPTDTIANGSITRSKSEISLVIPTSRKESSAFLSEILKKPESKIIR